MPDVFINHLITVQFQDISTALKYLNLLFLKTKDYYVTELLDCFI